MRAFAARRGRRAGRVRARHDRRHQRAARAARARAPRSSPRAGFRDVIEIGRQDRADLYDLAAVRPPPLVPRELRFTRRRADGAGGRARAAGRGRARGRGRDAVREAESRPSRCACCSRSCTRSTSARSARRCARRCPTCTSRSPREVLPEFREYERFATTTADAYLGAAAGRLPARLAAAGGGGGRAGAAGDAVLGRRGRRRDRGRAARRAACSPARPAAWSARPTSARASGYEDVLTFDMGGTSTDVAPVVGGEARHDDGVGRRRRPDHAARWSTCTR